MLAHTTRVMNKLEHKYPWARLVFRFDHSSCHKKTADNGLSVAKMNLNPGGAQHKMRDTTFGGKTYSMVFKLGDVVQVGEHTGDAITVQHRLLGQAKGLKQVSPYLQLHPKKH